MANQHLNKDELARLEELIFGDVVRECYVCEEPIPEGVTELPNDDWIWLCSDECRFAFFGPLYGSSTRFDWSAFRWPTRSPDDLRGIPQEGDA
jgi:hypothetical protein